MHAGSIERILAVLDAQEAGALLERLRPERGTSFSALRDLNGPLASRCCTMLCASPEPMPDTRAKQRRGAGVGVDADRR
jgi:hypothetical protein